MAQNSHCLQAEAEYFFQTFEMADEEYEPNSENLELDSDLCPWKVVKSRKKPQRRYTVSHTAPPAPPSTPTSLSKEHDPLNEMSLSPSAPTIDANGNANGGVVHTADDECRLSSLFYILDYAPKYKKKLKEQQRTDAELADLFKVVTITGRSTGSNNGKNTSNDSSIKSTSEHGVSIASRRIRRQFSSRELNATSLRIHRNSEFLRDLHDEDSLSAPEFDAVADDGTGHCSKSVRRYRSRLGHNGRVKLHKVRAKRLELMERMDEITDTFDTVMSIRPTQ